MTEIINVVFRLFGSLILAIFCFVEENKHRFETAGMHLIGNASYFVALKQSLKIIVKAVMEEKYCRTT